MCLCLLFAHVSGFPYLIPSATLLKCWKEKGKNTSFFGIMQETASLNLPEIFLSELQLSVDNGVVKEKEKDKFNLTLPVELKVEFDEVSDFYGGHGRKWLVLSAAMAMFLQATDEDRRRFVTEIREAEIDGFRGLVSRIASRRDPGVARAAKSVGDAKRQSRL